MRINFFIMFVKLMSSNLERIAINTMKSFFIFGFRRIKKSTPKTALGIRNQIIRLTSETSNTFRLLEQNLFVPSTVTIIRI